MSEYHFFTPCPKGVEAVLVEELNEIANQFPELKNIQHTLGGVHFSGTWKVAMAVNLYSRIASRVLMLMSLQPYRHEEEIYELTTNLPWESVITAQQTLRVDCIAHQSPLKSLAFTTLRIKDAVCDRLRVKTGSRPYVNTNNPDVRISAYLTENTITIYLDTSGEPLFKRGWRLEKGAAPLKENLAAAILRLSHWQAGQALYDPMCGSGTFLIEAAQIALNIPPGINRYFGFEKLLIHQADAWKNMREQALAQHQIKCAEPSAQAALAAITGSDISSTLLTKAKNNFTRAGISHIALKQIDALEIERPPFENGILLLNPPYGERILPRGKIAQSAHHPIDHISNFTRADTSIDAHFFDQFGQILKKKFASWQIYILTSERKLPGQLRLQESRKTLIYNGALECRLFRFDMVAGHFQKKKPKKHERI